MALHILHQKLQPMTPFRLNLIRHRFARQTDQTTLQLLKSFAAHKSDPSLVILLVDSTKQSYTALASQKQIDQLTANHLCLYFTSWNREQHYSLSGIIHLQTTLTIDTLQMALPLAEWFDTYQYYVKKCCSQDEEMSIIGALCYRSLFLYHKDLLQSVLAHPEWIALNKDREKPIIIDFEVKPFCAPGKSIEMIFVRSEQSKKEPAQEFFLDLYDGTPKQYPRGDMMLFTLITTKLEDDFSDSQCKKYIFNHTAYLGTKIAWPFLAWPTSTRSSYLKTALLYP